MVSVGNAGLLGRLGVCLYGMRVWQEGADKEDMSMPTGFICSSPLYQYKGWTFEFGQMTGPWPLRKDGEPRKRAGDVFWNIFEQWNNEPDKERYRIGGGCQRF